MVFGCGVFFTVTIKNMHLCTTMQWLDSESVQIIMNTKLTARLVCAYNSKHSNTICWCFHCIEKGVSADADPHYQKLYGRVTDVCSNRRGQPSPSAMKEPRPGRNPSVIRFASPSGKYGFQNWYTPVPLFGNLYNTCGYCCFLFCSLTNTYIYYTSYNSHNV